MNSITLKQTQDTARVLLHVMRRMDDEEFKRNDDGKKVIYLLDSDIVGLYANPQHTMGYTDAFLPKHEDAAALAWTIAEYIFTARRLGTTCMALPHRYETLSNLEAVMRSTDKEAKSTPPEQLLAFLGELATNADGAPRTFYQDNHRYKKLLQMLYGYAGGASKNFEARRFLKALRERWIDPLEEHLPHGIWPDEQEIQISIDAWFERIRKTRNYFRYDAEPDAVRAHQKLAEDDGHTAKSLRDYADAVVLASIEAANDKLAHHDDIRLLLVTGSSTLHLAAGLYTHGSDKQSFGHRYLRHPLMLLAAPDLLPDIENPSASQDLALFFERALLPDSVDFGKREENTALLCEALFGSLEESPLDVRKELELLQPAHAHAHVVRRVDESRLAASLTTEVKQNLANAVRVSAVKLGMPTLEDADKRARQDLAAPGSTPESSYTRFKELLDAESKKTTNDFLATLFDLGLEQLLRESRLRCNEDGQHLELRRGTPYIEFGEFELAKQFYRKLSDAKIPADPLSGDFRQLRERMLIDDPTRYTLALVYGLAFAHLGAWDLCARCAEFAFGIAQRLDCDKQYCTIKMREIHGDEAAYLLASAKRHTALDFQDLDEAVSALEEAVAIWSEIHHNSSLDPRMQSEHLAMEVSRWTLARYSSIKNGAAKTGLKSLADLQLELLKMLDGFRCPEQYDKAPTYPMLCILEEQLLVNLFIVTLMREIPSRRASDIQGDPNATEVFSRKGKRGLTFYLEMYHHMLDCKHKVRPSALVWAVFYVASALYAKELAKWNTPNGYEEHMSELRRWCKPGWGLLPRDLKRMKEYLQCVEQHVPPPVQNMK